MALLGSPVSSAWMTLAFNMPGWRGRSRKKNMANGTSEIRSWELTYPLPRHFWRCFREGQNMVATMSMRDISPARPGTRPGLGKRPWYQSPRSWAMAHPRNPLRPTMMTRHQDVYQSWHASQASHRRIPRHQVFFPLDFGTTLKCDVSNSSCIQKGKNSTERGWKTINNHFIYCSTTEQARISWRFISPSHQNLPFFTLSSPANLRRETNEPEVYSAPAEQSQMGEPSPKVWSHGGPYSKAGGPQTLQAWQLNRGDVMWMVGFVNWKGPCAPV